jgi:hypothetical protein
MEEVNEKSTYVVKCSFKDENGLEVIPDSLVYRLDDEATGEELVEDTTAVPTDVFYNVTIPSSANAILNDDRKFEIKVLTAQFTFQTTKVGTAEYRYKLLNLKYLI